MTRSGRVVLGLVACAIAVATVYRFQIGNGFALLSGDVYDARIEISLLEHWRAVLFGWDQWRQPPFFTPLPDTLGYNDGYFLMGLIYAALRWLGGDPFLAAELVGAILRVIGFGAFLLFAQQVCRLPWAWSLLGAVLFTISNGALMQSSHGQLLTLALAPLLGWLLWAVWDASSRARPGRALAWGLAAAMLFDAWLMTAFYTLWFTVFFAALMAAVVLLQRAGRGRVAWRTLPARWPLLVGAAALLAGMTPFVMTYAPTARESGMHPFSDVLPLTPGLADLVNFGAGNFAYGWFDRWLAARFPYSFIVHGEHAAGVPLLLLAGALWAAVTAWQDRPAPMRAWWRTVGLALAASLLLCFHIGSHSLWWLVYTLVPGAAAVRAITRFMLFLIIPIILLAMWLLARNAGRTPRTVQILLAALLILEELNGQPTLELDRPAELAMLRRVPPAPASCQRFFVDAPRVSTAWRPSLLVNIDAMLVAQSIHLPTVNGHASFVPDDYYFDVDDKAGYLARIASTALEHGVATGLCRLDLVNMTWSPFPVHVAPLVPGRPVDLNTRGGDRYLLTGWGEPEPEGRWTSAATAGMDFVNPLPGRELDLSMVAFPFAPLGATSSITVSVNGHTVAHWQPAESWHTLRARIPAEHLAGTDDVHVELHIATPRRPVDVDLGTDERRLGLFVQSFTVTADATQPAF